MCHSLVPMTRFHSCTLRPGSAAPSGLVKVPDKVREAPCRSRIEVALGAVSVSRVADGGVIVSAAEPDVLGV
jgi:hypothetical protein